jgi:nucleoid DNA-binding protein
MMQKKELIDAIAGESGLTPKQVERTLEALGTVATRQLARGSAAKLPGLGKLVPVARAARPGRLPASTTVRCAPGGDLTAAGNPAPRPEPGF